MAETLEQYMSKTRADYGSRVARTKVEDKDNFELKGQFLKELCTNTFSAIQAQLNNLGREIKKVNEKVYAAKVGCEQCKGPHYTKDCPLKAEGKTLEEAYYIQFGGPFQRGGYRAAAPGSYGPQFSKAYFEASHIDNSIPIKEKDLRSFTLPCFINNVCFDNALVDLGASVSVIPLSTYVNIGLGGLAYAKLIVELADKTVKYPKRIAKDVLVRIELRRDQGDDLMPTIEEGKVIYEFRTRDVDLNNGINDYPSYYDHDKKIHIDCAHNLKFSCMIRFKFTHVNFFPLLYVNVMSKKFHNSITKDKMMYKGNNVVGALMNVPIFVGTFSVVTDFLVLEDMDAYRDEDMGDVIFGEPFFREVGINARRFEGIITIYNGNDEVTYQMV
nr:hypothetical protein [Tanacetum cinerariifolium]